MIDIALHAWLGKDYTSSGISMIAIATRTLWYGSDESGGVVINTYLEDNSCSSAGS